MGNEKKKVKMRDFIPLGLSKEELEDYKKALETRIKGIEKLQLKTPQNTTYQQKFFQVSENNKQKYKNQLKEVNNRLCS